MTKKEDKKKEKEETKEDELPLVLRRLLKKLSE